MIHTDEKPSIANAPQLPVMNSTKTIHVNLDDCNENIYGELVYSTGIYKWSDGTLHTEPEYPFK